jgi:hypothetical protein
MVSIDGVTYRIERIASKTYGVVRVNDEETYTVLGGLRVFLGDNMSLIDRHRRQDQHALPAQAVLKHLRGAGEAGGRRLGHYAGRVAQR